jgi:hypothetical protein
MLESLTVGREFSRLALILVYDDHLVDRPAKRNGALAQVVLTFGTFDILQDLTW